jgi:single-strand DNA-binding protein
MNIVIIDGRLTYDPEVRYTNTGKAVAEITLAVDVGFGENKKTSFIKCEAWEKKAETIGNTLSKGRKILIKGEWMQQQWEKDGVKRTKDYCRIDSFEYMDSKKDQDGEKPMESNMVGGYDINNFGTEIITEEEIPF